jgi:UDP-N-acetylglucosamine/UDP-N-acetylgalactosamine diphosphorylase
LERIGKMSLAPNGNGALFEAVSTNNEVKAVIESVEYVQIIGVDNVLNKILDPIYIGFTIKKDLQAAMKSCIKRDVKEPVGVIVKKNKKYEIVEYSELSDIEASKMDPKTGQLMFNLGNILIFLLKADKLLELCSNKDTLNSLYHKAVKKIPYWDPSQ